MIEFEHSLTRLTSAEEAVSRNIHSVDDGQKSIAEHREALSQFRELRDQQLQSILDKSGLGICSEAGLHGGEGPAGLGIYKTSEIRGKAVTYKSHFGGTPMERTVIKRLCPEHVSYIPAKGVLEIKDISDASIEDRFDREIIREDIYGFFGLRTLPVSA